MLESGLARLFVMKGLGSRFSASRPGNITLNRNRNATSAERIFFSPATAPKLLQRCTGHQAWIPEGEEWLEEQGARLRVCLSCMAVWLTAGCRSGVKLTWEFVLSRPAVREALGGEGSIVTSVYA